MPIDVTIVIGGKAGQGILTVGELITLTGLRSGYYLFSNNEFESRIRGGHSFSQIRISNRPIEAPTNTVHLLVALDPETIDIHKHRLAADSIVLTEDEQLWDEKAVLQVPFTDLAKKSGDKITANAVAAGACLSLLGAPVEPLKNTVDDLFRGKGSEILKRNINAAEAGYNAVTDRHFKYAFEWKPGPVKGILIDGAKAAALGALAGDCRMAAFYPMSPATGILAHLSALSDAFPLVVEQAEDEIAAINMAIGASFAGVRAFTATSGGGFCLMTEALGLAGITETPVVIVNAQRPGPATGLPTRTAQGDLLFCIRAAQDEFPRFVFAPSTPYEIYDITARAFHLADKYQVPAIILMDKYLTDSLFTIDRFKAPEHIPHFTAHEKDMTIPEDYRRYAVTDSGISPRALPCQGKALVLVSGNEHREDGHISEADSNRAAMVDKRNRKIKTMLNEIDPPKPYFGDAEILLVGWGSTQGAIKEGVDYLRAKGMDIGTVIFSDLWPFPKEAVRNALGRAKRFITVEQNSTAQLGTLIREQTGLNYSGKVLKYDGRPFYPQEIADSVLNL